MEGSESDNFRHLPGIRIAEVYYLMITCITAPILLVVIRSLHPTFVISDLATSAPVDGSWMGSTNQRA
eukprot:scaffold22647_cov145-Cylindrotheca_fusiformis.AAC.4